MEYKNKAKDGSELETLQYKVSNGSLINYTEGTMGAFG